MDLLNDLLAPACPGSRAGARAERAQLEPEALQGLSARAVKVLRPDGVFLASCWIEPEGEASRFGLSWCDYVPQAGQFCELPLSVRLAAGQR